MFEASLLPERKGRDARLVRVIAIGSLAAQAITVATFIVVPLLYPAKLPAMNVAPKMTSLDFVKKPPVKVIVVKPQEVPNTNQAAVHVPSPQVAAATQAPRLGAASHPSLTNSSDIPVLLAVGGGPGMGSPLDLGSGGSPFGKPNGTGNVVVAKPVAPAVPVNVSSGVSKGLLLSPMKPAYPKIAVAAHIEGTVVVTAIIDKLGRIINVQVVSGPAMLRDAAAEAVREARYKPYMLNGQPTEVITTVSITFTMNGQTA